MIDPKEMLATLVDHFATTAKVQNVFGEPIESHGKTIIPVARVSYRLGAGGGEGERSLPTHPRPRRAAEEVAAAASCRQLRSACWKSPKPARASYASSIRRWQPA